MATPTTDGVTIVNTALEYRDGSAAAVAETSTGFTAGTIAGARKSTMPETGPTGGEHGFDPATQICPRAAVPLVIPFTAQVTPWLALSATAAANNTSCPAFTVADAGEIVTAIPS